MKGLLVILLCFNYSFGLTQTINDSNDVAVGITAYPYTDAFKTGSLAIGPTMFFNNDRKVAFQIGLLWNITPYSGYQHIAHTTQVKVKYPHLYIPLLFHYNFYNLKKINCFFTGGIILENSDIDEEGVILNFTGGTGISYHIIKKLFLKVSPTLRYSKKQFYPGALIDLSIPFKLGDE